MSCRPVCSISEPGLDDLIVRDRVGDRAGDVLGISIDRSDGFVGRKKPNLFGLYDMGGNVAEWIGDFYEFYPEPGADPEWIDLSQRELRLARGGGYSAEVHVSQTYWRAGTLGTITTPTIGVRCARER